MCTKSVKFGLANYQALHHLLCMRTGKPMPYIIKAKWYVRTVCSHRHSSGGNGSCMAPTADDVNLFWALSGSICHQCPHMFSSLKFKRKIFWSFPGSAHQRELLRCMWCTEWSATSANWKVPIWWKSRFATLSRIHQALVEHFSSWSHHCQLDPPAPRFSAAGMDRMKNHEKSGWVHLIWNPGQVLTAGCGETPGRARTLISDQSKEVSQDRERRRKLDRCIQTAIDSARRDWRLFFRTFQPRFVISEVGRFRRMNPRWKAWNPGPSKATAPFLFPCRQGNER